jgi:hypothetical protein
MEYDAKIIVEFASRLYSKAGNIIAMYTILGLLIGGFAGMSMGRDTGAIIGALIVGAIGYSLGSDRAFQFKLQAQVALCQVQIELNTRRA